MEIVGFEFMHLVAYENAMQWLVLEVVKIEREVGGSTDIFRFNSSPKV